MTVIEIKAKIFDILAEIEQLQIKANELNRQRIELVKQLQDIEKS